MRRVGQNNFCVGLLTVFSLHAGFAVADDVIRPRLALRNSDRIEPPSKQLTSSRVAEIRYASLSLRLTDQLRLTEPTKLPDLQPESGKSKNQLDVDVAVTYGRHIQAVAPRSIERGVQLHAKYVRDDASFGLHAEGRIRTNDAYRRDVYSPDARDAYRYSADWRELYVTKNVADWNLSFGLQQVVWGKADNFRVVDLVNPVNLRDFVLPDLNDYRKPVTMLRGSRAVADWNLELLYIPWFEPTTFARSGSEYDIPLLNPDMMQGIKLLPEKRPSRRIGNGELGVHVSRSFDATDLSLFLFYTRDDNPVFKRSIQFDAQNNPELALQAEYHRQLMAGASLARSLGNGIVLRTEAAYVPNMTYMSSMTEDGLTKGATITGLLGLDYLWRDWLLTFQTSDRWISGWNNDFLVPRHAPFYTLSATGNSFAGRLESRVALTSFVNGIDGSWLQLKTTWKPDDRWAYSVGADFFDGPAQGTYGQFRDKDRLWLELKYRF